MGAMVGDDWGGEGLGMGGGFGIKGVRVSARAEKARAAKQSDEPMEVIEMRLTNGTLRDARD
jgi:hypothetical protein